MGDAASAELGITTAAVDPGGDMIGLRLAGAP